MNKTYRVIWSKVRNGYVVVSELARRNGKRTKGSLKIGIALQRTTLLTLCLLGGLYGTILGANATVAQAKAVPTQENDAKQNQDAGLVWGNGAIAIGKDAYVQGGDAIAIGKGAYVQGGDAIAIGHAKVVPGNGNQSTTGSIAIGDAATHAEGEKLVVIGNNANSVAKTSTVVIGKDVTGNASNSVVIGVGSSAPRSKDTSNVVIGENSTITGNRSVAIGNGTANNSSQQQGASVIGDDSLALGASTSVSANQSTAIGYKAYATGGKYVEGGLAAGNDVSVSNGGTTAVGRHVGATSVNGSAFGTGAYVSGQNSTALGYNVNVSGANSVALGTGDSYQGKDTGITKFSTPTGVSGNKSVGIGFATNVSGNSSLGIGEGVNVAANAGIGIGRNANASSGENTIAIGTQAGATGANAVALGKKAKSSGENAIAIGTTATVLSTDYMGNIIKDEKGNIVTEEVSALATGKNSLALGNNTLANGESSTALGMGARTTGRQSTALGFNANAGGASSLALGEGARSLAGRSIAMGINAKSNAKNAIAIGNDDTNSEGNTQQTWALAENSIALGTMAVTNTDAKDGIALGTGARANGAAGIAAGKDAYAAGNAAALGDGAKAYGSQALALGKDANAWGTRALAFGKAGAGEDSIAMGEGANAWKSYAIAMGKDSVGGTEDGIAIGKGASVANPYKEDPENPGNWIEDQEQPATGAISLGHNAKADVQGGIALGSGSEAHRAAGVAGFDFTTGAASTNKSFAWTSTLGALSIGSGSHTRQITGVAAGTQDTDAVNVAQLRNVWDNVVKDIKAGDGITVTKDNSGHYTIATNLKGGATNTATTTVEAVDNVSGNPSVAPAQKDDAKAKQESQAKRKFIRRNAPIRKTAEVTTQKGNAVSIKTTTSPIQMQADSGKGFELNTAGNVTLTGGATGALSDNNIAVVSDGARTLTVKLAQDLTGLSSITSTTIQAGDTQIDTNGVTIKDGPSITKDRIDANNTKITHVAAGTQDSDAVNYGQLKETNQNVNRLDHFVSKLDNRLDRVGAGAAALAALHPLDFDPDEKWDFAAGYGNYRGANAAAIGAYYRPNEDTMFSVGGSFGGGENMVNAGVSWKFGHGNNYSGYSRSELVRTITDQKETIQQQGKEIQELKTQMAAVMKQLQKLK